MQRAVLWVSSAALIALLFAMALLGRLERGGPPHATVALTGGIPATLYLPPSAGEPDSGRIFTDPPAIGERPPAVLLMHGFSSDRSAVSTLARRLAAAGYAVLALDVRGHGENRNPFSRDRASSNSFYPELATAVDYLRALPHVDGLRIALMGHSMGASAVLDYATRDSAIDAAVLISGGASLQGPYRPPNALFISANGDPERIRERARELTLRLAAEAAPPDFDGRLALARTYGDTTKGNAVRAVEVPGADHLTILWSRVAAGEITRWLDGVFGVERQPAGRSDAVASDPRLAAALFGALALLFTLPGLGMVAGRLAPKPPERPSMGAVFGAALLVVALAATLPILAVGAPAALLGLEVGDLVVSHLSLAGIVTLAALVFMGRLDVGPLARELREAFPAAALSVLVLYALVAPLGVVFHRTTLTPERAFAFALAALALLPATLAFQLLLRRGRPGVAALLSIAGRVLVLATLAVGVEFGVLPGVVMLMLPSLVIAFALAEVLASGVYLASRNIALVAWIEAGWLGLVIAMVMPIRL